MIILPPLTHLVAYTMLALLLLAGLAAVVAWWIVNNRSVKK